jgi:hypothetical protein
MKYIIIKVDIIPTIVHHFMISALLFFRSICSTPSSSEEIEAAVPVVTLNASGTAAIQMGQNDSFTGFLLFSSSFIFLNSFIIIKIFFILTIKKEFFILKIKNNCKIKMYYLNSDGTLDTSITEIENYNKCNCNMCLQKRKSSSKKWFPWTSIILISIFIVIVLVSCNIEKILAYFYNCSSSSSTSSPSSYSESTTTTTTTTTPSSSSDSNNKDFEFPLLL